MIKRITLIILTFILIVQNPGSAQNLEDEIGFQYVKGNYLFDSGRYDEAIQIYNGIIKKDPGYEQVLIYRAKAKYALGAYKGAKNDGLDYISVNGLNKEVCLVLGKSELGLGNPMIAISYLDYAIMKDKEDAEGYYYRGEAYFEVEDDVNACTDWHIAKLRGSDLAERKANQYCQRVPIRIDEYKKVETSVVEYPVIQEDEVLSAGTRIDEVDETRPKRDTVIMEEVTNWKDRTTDYIDSSLIVREPEIEEVIEPIDNTIEILPIDADLDIKIYGGVGSREVRVIPDILILAENSGQVIVDICIDKSGNVVKASLNRDESTISSAGLISLALRKSREFKFDRSMKDEQCGKLGFLIK